MVFIQIFIEILVWDFIYFRKSKKILVFHRAKNKDFDNKKCLLEIKERIPFVLFGIIIP